jgi:hypothetical protein
VVGLPTDSMYTSPLKMFITNELCLFGGQRLNQQNSIEVILASLRFNDLIAEINRKHRFDPALLWKGSEHDLQKTRCHPSSMILPAEFGRLLRARD